MEEKQCSILIVDDNEEIRTYLHELLADNFNVLMANDGLEAFDKLIANKRNTIGTAIKYFLIM